MKRSDLGIVAGFALLGLIAAFWFVVLAPKRDEAKQLGDEVAELESAVAAQEQLVATAKSAQKDYDDNYHRLVVLGKAVPKDADTSSLLVELQGISDRAKVGFDSIALSQTAESPSAAPATPPPAPTQPPAEPAPEGETPEPGAAEATPAAAAAPSATDPTAGAATAAIPVAPATEAAAASLPLGAAVGTASLPVMPYNLTFSGGFFEIADFLEGLDGLVKSNKGGAGVSGRLLTIDGFSLTPLESEPDAPPSDDPPLAASLAVTTYLAPPVDGLTAGATPTAPAGTAPAVPTPASSTTPAPAP